MTVFRGYMKMPLGGDSVWELIENTEFKGDWATKRRRILKKERKFKVTLHIYDVDGYRRAFEDINFKDKVGDESLATVLSELGTAFIKEISSSSDINVDMAKSYAIIKA